MNSVKLQLLQKASGIKFERQKNHNKMYLFYGFKDKVINAAPKKTKSSTS